MNQLQLETCSIREHIGQEIARSLRQRQIHRQTRIYQRKKQEREMWIYASEGNLRQ